MYCWSWPNWLRHFLFWILEVKAPLMLWATFCSSASRVWCVQIGVGVGFILDYDVLSLVSVLDSKCGTICLQHLNLKVFFYVCSNNLCCLMIWVLLQFVGKWRRLHEARASRFSFHTEKTEDGTLWRERWSESIQRGSSQTSPDSVQVYLAL